MVDLVLRTAPKASSGLGPKEHLTVNDPSSKWHIYIIECQDKSLYVGTTNNIQRRLNEHETGKGSKFVRSRKLSKLVYVETLSNKYDAFRREREIKGFSRQKKLELIKLGDQSIPL